jgi:hypothetical protein
MLKMKSFTLGLALVCCAFSAFAQRGPSTPEERTRAVEMATFLETNPLAKEAKDYRAKLLFFLAEVPDITVKLCTSVLGESKRVKGDYDSELVGQLAILRQNLSSSIQIRRRMKLPCIWRPSKECSERGKR